MSPRRSSNMRCPVCGEGVLGDIAYDEAPAFPEQKQVPESLELLTYSCGHEVEGRPLADAASDDQNVERRTSGESIVPVAKEGR
jgi:hypothetical protein